MKYKVFDVEVMKVFPRILLVFLMLHWPLGALATESLLTVDTAVSIALQDNPNYAQIQARYRALLNIPSQVGSLPDPIIALNGMNLPVNSFDTKQEAMTQIQLGISQAIPFPGKLSLKKKVAQYEPAIGLNNAFELRLKLKQQVTSVWWELYYIERSLEIIDTNLRLLRQFLKIAETKYKVGDGLQQDVLLAQLEISKLLEQEIKVKSLHQNEIATLNTLMGRNANIPISLNKHTVDKLENISPVETLISEALEKNPLLKKEEKLISAAKSRLELAEKEFYPDFKVGVTYGDRRGNNPAMAGGGKRDDFVSLMLNMSVPLYANGKQSKGVSQKEYELLQSKKSHQDVHNTLISRVVSLSSDYSKNRDLFKLLQTGIIPQARQTVDSMLSGYKVSEVDFLNLVRSQITLLNYQIRYWRTLSQGKQLHAKLDEITVGENLYE